MENLPGPSLFLPDEENGMVWAGDEKIMLQEAAVL
jgi:hypothetical protein